MQLFQLTDTMLVKNYTCLLFPNYNTRAGQPQDFQGEHFPFNLYKNHMVAQSVKSLPAICETQVQSLDQEDPLEKAMATHSSILAWRIPWTEEPRGL